MVSTTPTVEIQAAHLPRDNFHSKKSLICSRNSTAASGILQVVLVTNSFAKRLPESREGKSVETRNQVGANDAALERLLNIDEAARIIGRAHWTLRRDIRGGKLTCVRIGRRIMIEPSEIRRLIEEGRK
jgi:hypothetical protein